jgi:ParB family chromosome partitioning protein
MGAEGLDELTQSIRQNGVIQPILVRRAGPRFQIIAGERRWRAALKAGLDKVPVVVRDVDGDQNVLELALIENIQRENLNPIDEARAYERLAGEFGLTQDQIAAAVGKDRSTIANFIRLLRLPEDVRSALAAGTLSMGHARAILGLADATVQRQVSGQVLNDGLSVRETEALVRRALSGVLPGAAKSPRPRNVNDVDTRAAEAKLKFALGTPVRIVRRGQGGRIEVDFGSEPELMRLYDYLTDRR